MPRFVPVEELFKGRHFDREIVVLCLRWYLSFKLSYRDLVAIMSERGLGLAHTMILRWVARLHAGIREALEAVRPRREWIVADGRDLL